MSATKVDWKLAGRGAVLVVAFVATFASGGGLIATALDWIAPGYYPGVFPHAHQNGNAVRLGVLTGVFQGVMLGFAVGSAVGLASCWFGHLRWADCVRAFALVCGCAAVFAIGGGLGGLALGVYMPAYYRGVVTGGGASDFNPADVGIGLGASQGLIAGAVVGGLLAVGLAWRRKRKERRSAMSYPTLAVRARLRRAVDALGSAKLRYAVAGGNAVAAWVARVDEGATRNTPDVDILVPRSAMEAAVLALECAGFSRVPARDGVRFAESPTASHRQAVQLFVASEKVRLEYAHPAPDVEECEASVEGFNVLMLEPLIRMKLTSFRRKDQVHVQDMIGVGLIDQSWTARLPADLAARLQELLDDPEG